MKILFVTNAQGPDYMSDMVFHGGKELFGKNFIETKRLWYMYDDVKDKKSLYGRGFTVYGKIKNDLYSELPDSINNLIESKFFDKIIYGSIWRCSDYIDKVTKVYDKKDIILIDGEDKTLLMDGFINRGTYFKRELYAETKNVYPISFAIPENLILNKVTDKTKLISDIIPNSNRKYSFDSETEYYKEYATSWYANTKKKGGWDCLRHYEIMMNGCVPLFENLEKCPKLTMTNFPKKEIIEFSKEKEKNLENNNFILNYTKDNLTTKILLSKIL